jgi:hypothetical protein
VKSRRIIISGSTSIVLLAFLLLRSSRVTFPSLPVPNGYDDLVSTLPIMPQQPNDVRTLDATNLRLLVSSNAHGVSKVREAFSKDWAVPVSVGEEYMLTVTSNVMLTRTLARALCAEGKLAELEGRTNDALSAYMDCIQLGQKGSRGGLLIHNLVGVACKGMGVKEMWKIIPTSSTPALRRVLSALLKMEASSESAETIIDRDRDWSRGSMGWFWFSVQSISMRSTLQQTRASTRVSHQQGEAKLRLLRTDVALELFRRKNERYPFNLTELVPEFLEEAPIDPFGGKPLVYRSLTNSYLLYSVGPDEKDDGGTPAAVGWGEIGPQGFSNVPAQGDIISTAPR